MVANRRRVNTIRHIIYEKQDLSLILFYEDPFSICNYSDSKAAYHSILILLYRFYFLNCWLKFLLDQSIILEDVLNFFAMSLLIHQD